MHFSVLALILTSAHSTVCSPALPCGEVMTTFNGIRAFSNGQDQCGTDGCATGSGPPSTYGQQYLCTELVNRYYNLTYGIDVTNWKTVAKDYCTHHPIGVYVAAIPSQVPNRGDIYVKASGSLGHVCIVMDYIPNYQGNGAAVSVIEQNADISGINIYPAYHEGCFLTANYSRSCDYLDPGNPSCGIHDLTGTDDPTDDPIDDNNNSENKSNLGVEGIVGIIVGGIAVCGILTVIGMYLFYQKAPKNNDNSIMTKNLVRDVGMVNTEEVHQH